MTSLPPVVLIHGMWSTPDILAPLAEQFIAAGYQVHCPRLPLHFPRDQLSPAKLEELGHTGIESYVQLLLQLVQSLLHRMEKLIMSSWQNKVVLITGTGSGLGKALARLMASKGAQLVLTDIDSQSLAATCDELGLAVVLSKTADVSSKSDWQALVMAIEKQTGHLDILVNNAGMSMFGYFHETSQPLFDKLMSVNLNGVIIGCRECMPLLEKSPRGLIVNIASVFGLITMPMLSAYHTSKFAVRGFSEALKQDLQYAGKTIDVICPMPGGIKTNIAQSAVTTSKDKHAFGNHFDAIALTSAEKAAKVIEKGMRKKTSAYRLVSTLNCSIFCIGCFLPVM